MILTTVGTTMPFDELIEEVDRLAGLGKLGSPGETVMCQSGKSSYKAANLDQFAYRDSLHDLIEASALVVTHGGATVVQLLLARRPFVAFPNPRGAGDHQTGFLRQVATIAEISWSTDVADLERLAAERIRLGPASVKAGLPRARDALRHMLGLARSPS